MMNLRLSVVLSKVLLCVAPIGLATSASSNVITDWDARGAGLVGPGVVGQRKIAIVNIAMFGAVNSIERRYRPYAVQLPAPRTTSQEAAAAAAASAVLVALCPENVAEIEALLASDLAKIPDDTGKADGIKLGNQIAVAVLQTRANDGANAADAYRPKTTPGAYVPTGPMIGSMFPSVTPFVLTTASQFRPPPPIALQSEEWAHDYNETKALGGKASTARSAQQTEIARFWLMSGPAAYHPIARQLVEAKHMSVIDSARFMTLYAMAMIDAYIAVFDAKYQYGFWRPLTAIRNGDLDDNPATERDPTWQPFDATPMHPEYPCAHCVEIGAAVSVIEAVLGSQDIPEVAMTSPTAPGVVHRWTNLRVLADEVANARICSGFHYRFSTRVGVEMGRKIGRYTVQHAMQPAETVAP